MTQTLYYAMFLMFFVVISAQSDSDLFGDRLKIRDARPNIVMVVMDDVGIGDLPPLNNSSSSRRRSDVSTPFYESLLGRKTSIRLSNYYTHSFCTPARASLLSGMDRTCIEAAYIQYK